nr:MAG TPA: hypothetical protein [Inoviridae sp.]
MISIILFVYKFYNIHIDNIQVTDLYLALM